jgi:hypothetical protein
MKKEILVSVLALAASGCATSSINYTPPVAVNIENSKHVNQPFDLIWDRLVKNLSSDFFVINNIDKNSRLINVSFTSQHPSEFVNCGRTTRTFKNARGENTYDYKAADSTIYTATNASGIASNVRRLTKLEGRSNIYVAPEGNGANVTVNTKYVVNVNLTGTPFGGGPAWTANSIFDFSTKQSYSDAVVTCISLGTVESKVLSFAGD